MGNVIVNSKKSKGCRLTADLALVDAMIEICPWYQILSRIVLNSDRKKLLKDIESQKENDAVVLKVNKSQIVYVPDSYVV